MLNIKTKLRRAFTIVELVVVIAVIAALAAILIPTFANVINSANEANDTSLAKNMNTSLTSYGVLYGNPETAHEAVEALKSDGYLLQNMTPTSDGYNYIWDKNTNSVALLTDKFEISYSQYDDILTNEKSELWAIVSTQDQVEAFQNSGYTFSYCIVSEEELKVDNSFDSYMVTNANVTLTSNTTGTLTIYTNGGEVAINAPSAEEIIHEGTASLVNANAVNTSSYHLYGEAKMLVLTSGRVVVKNGASVSILALNDSQTGTRTIEVEADNVSDAIGSIYSTTGNSVTITVGSESKTVSTIQNSSLSNGVSGITYITGSSSDEVTSNFKSFITKGYGIAVLQTNVTTDSAITLTNGNFVMIDLNGFTLTSTSVSSNGVTNSSELTISNGTLSFDKMETGDRGALVAESNSKITLNNVDATTNGTMLYPKGDAAEVNVINSTIYSTGSYGIGTNASTEYTCTINIENSTITVKEYGTTILVNIDVTLNISNSTLVSGNYGESGNSHDGLGAQVILCRSGKINISDTEITLYTNFTNTNGSSDGTATGAGALNNYYVSWTSGNAAPFTAIALGDASTTANYHTTNAVLSMTGCTVNVLDTATGKALAGGRAIYMYGKDETGYKSSLTFDSATKINGYIIVGGSQDVTLTSYSAKYQCGFVTINGISYYPVTNSDSTTTGKKYTASGTTLTEVS